MQACRVAPALLITGFVLASVVTARAGEPRAVLELFTSQGCSSCPPADRLVGQLANDSSLIALSVPIDYWDYLGWRDTLANPAHSARQRAYARTRGDGQVYTPQIVVNGSADALGSDQAAIERAIAQTDRKTGVMSLPVVLAVNNGALNVSISDADKAPAAAEVWLCPLAKAVPVAIGRGENRGHTITYHNVVRNWLKLGTLSAAQSSWNVPIAQIKAEGIDAAAVMVQEGSHDRPGIILGAALTDIR
ncbi:MAG TPA: DUF1223 domain-containing protein [Xanthobacteraceae bacterium]|nr:DUF1223 domain-containing protein [Xanthobacteraceae bacterium]